MNTSRIEIKSVAATAKYAGIRLPINALYVTLKQQTPAANHSFNIPASTLLGWPAEVLRFAARSDPAQPLSPENATHVVHFTLKDRTKAACKRVLDTMVYYGFRIVRQTKRAGVITVIVRYCAGNMAEALGELTKILPIAPNVLFGPFKFA